MDKHVPGVLLEIMTIDKQELKSKYGGSPEVEQQFERDLRRMDDNFVPALDALAKAPAPHKK